MIDEEVDEYGNPIDGSELIYCCFPDCGCDGARLCMAREGANYASLVLNIERGSATKERKNHERLFQ